MPWAFEGKTQQNSHIVEINAQFIRSEKPTKPGGECALQFVSHLVCKKQREIGVVSDWCF